MRPIKIAVLASIGAMALLPLASCAPAPSARPGAWTTAWTLSPNISAPLDDTAHPAAANGATVRETLRMSVAGDQVRVGLSNQLGSTAVTVGAASLARPLGAAAVTPGTQHRLTFGGQPTVVIAPGASVLSDPIPMAVDAGEALSLSLFLPQGASAFTQHGMGLGRAVAAWSGDQVEAIHIDQAAPLDSLPLASQVLVRAQAPQRLVATFGDSVTDGDGDITGVDQTWPSDLGRRLARLSAGARPIGVLNCGVAGNRLLHDGEGFGQAGVTRFERDALSLPGVTHVILLEGINDLGLPGATAGKRMMAPATQEPTAAELIGGLQQMIARAHAHHLRIIGATLTPSEGVTVVSGYNTPEKEAKRQAVNAWIRTSGAFDGVVDFDAVLRDPQHPTRLRPDYASRDHLHPNAAGYQAMADAVDPKLLD